MGKLTEVSDFHAVFPTIAHNTLQILLIRATVKRGQQMLEYSCEVAQCSSLAQWIQSPSAEVDRCTDRVRCVKKKQCQFGCEDC